MDRVCEVESLEEEEGVDIQEEEEEGVVGKVLVVDDAAMNRKMLVRLLEGSCEGTDVAEDGQIAVDMVKRSLEEGQPYSLITMDYQMPNMDGPTATKLIRELGFVGPIIGVTGNALHADQNVFIASGANRVLTKPVDFDTLMDALREVTEQLRKDKM